MAPIPDAVPESHFDYLAQEYTNTQEAAMLIEMREEKILNEVAALEQEAGLVAQVIFHNIETIIDRNLNPNEAAKLPPEERWVAVDDNGKQIDPKPQQAIFFALKGLTFDSDGSINPVTRIRIDTQDQDPTRKLYVLGGPGLTIEVPVREDTKNDSLQIGWDLSRPGVLGTYYRKRAQTEALEGITPGTAIDTPMQEVQFGGQLDESAAKISQIKYALLETARELANSYVGDTTEMAPETTTLSRYRDALSYLLKGLHMAMGVEEEQTLQEMAQKIEADLIQRAQPRVEVSKKAVQAQPLIHAPKLTITIGVISIVFNTNGTAYLELGPSAVGKSVTAERRRAQGYNRCPNLVQTVDRLLRGELGEKPIFTGLTGILDIMLIYPFRIEGGEVQLENPTSTGLLVLLNDEIAEVIRQTKQTKKIPWINALLRRFYVSKVLLALYNGLNEEDPEGKSKTPSPTISVRSGSPGQQKREV